MSAGLAVVQPQANGLAAFSPEQVDLIKRTVAKGASNDELQLFLTLAGKYGLDPFAKEIWCIKRQKKNAQGVYENDPLAPATIMTSRDGYLKIAQSDPDFDGLKSFVVREGDAFEIDAESDKVLHRFGAKRGKIIGAWATCYHKRRKPAVCFVDFAEYNAGSQVWQKYPSAMIQKVAEVFVLKRQFSISGLVSQEEMATQGYMPPAIDITPAEESTAEPAPYSVDRETPKLASDKQLRSIRAKAKEVGLTDEQLHAKAAVASLSDLTSAQASELIQALDEAREHTARMQALRELADVTTRLGIDKEVVRAEAEGMFLEADPRRLHSDQIVALKNHFLKLEHQTLDKELHPEVQQDAFEIDESEIPF